MSGYRKYIKVTVTVDGAQHEIALRPMTFEESLSIYDAGEAAGPDKSPESRRAQRLKTRALLADAVVSVTPAVVDADGSELSAKELMSAHYFADAQRQAVEAWVDGSQPRDPTSPAESSGGGQST